MRRGDCRLEKICARFAAKMIDDPGDLIPRHHTNDVVLFDPADLDDAIYFNRLMIPAGGNKTLVADGVLSAFQKVFGLDEAQAPKSP